MRRLLLDTNIYGLIVADSKKDDVVKNILTQALRIYGCDVIRKELRATKRKGTLRMDLLRLYDALVHKGYSVDTRMKALARQYYEAYIALGGVTPASKLNNDFSIIACASIKDLDVVVSNDTLTMCNDLQKKAYVIVNNSKSLKSPKFYSYTELKHEIM